MKKTKPNRQQIGKQAYQIAKTIGSADVNKLKSDVAQSSQIVDAVSQQESMRNFEAEVMGENGQGSKSDIKAKNLEQMVAVLHQRLGVLEVAAKTRMYLCAEDMNANSTNSSKQAPKITDEFEDNFQRAPKDVKVASHKDSNLVTSENVFVDATHLVLRTKAATDTGKKLEATLEESFSATSLRELKNKKAKVTRSDKAKRSEAQKFEAKKQMRVRLEKDLHTNMENYVTRSVNDPDLKFVAPINLSHEARWPITVKWPAHNEKSMQPDNIDGEMDPELLLRYSMEKINIPSGENMFRVLVRQDMIQEYFVNLFWLIKIKFFQPDSTNYDETYLLRRMSAEYVKLVEMIAQRAHAEHEKDFAYKFIPYILSNAVYCGFYFLCPGSRHIYTKSFRKTILMQVVKIMHGIQLHPLSIKVTWAKLFPEEVQEGGDEEGEEAGEVYPVQLAFSKKIVDSHKHHHHNHHHDVGAHASSDTLTAHQQPGSLTGVAAAAAAAATGKAHTGLMAGEAGVMSPTAIGGFESPSLASTGSSPLKPETPGNSMGGPMGGAGVLGRPPSSADMGRALMDEDAPTLEELQLHATLSHLPPGKPLMRTLLNPAPEKPHGMQSTVMRQHHEVADALELSPMLDEFFAAGAQGFRHSQPILRTMPISWCVAGGTDTHRRRPIPKELHDELSLRSSRSVKEFKKENTVSRIRALKIVQQVERSCSAVLSSGSQNISRMSLDLVKQQKRQSKPGVKEPGPSIDPTPVDQGFNLEKYANYQDEDLDAFFANI